MDYVILQIVKIHRIRSSIFYHVFKSPSGLISGFVCLSRSICIDIWRGHIAGEDDVCEARLYKCDSGFSHTVKRDAALHHNDRCDSGFSRTVKRNGASMESNVMAGDRDLSTLANVRAALDDSCPHATD